MLNWRSCCKYNVHQETPDMEIPLPKFRRGEIDAILNEYQRKYASNQDKHIIASARGKPTHQYPPNQHPSGKRLYRKSNIKPRSNAQF
jgi:hypothetical protein